MWLIWLGSGYMDPFIVMGPCPIRKRTLMFYLKRLSLETLPQTTINAIGQSVHQGGRPLEAALFFRVGVLVNAAALADVVTAWVDRARPEFLAYFGRVQWVVGIANVSVICSCTAGTYDFPTTTATYKSDDKYVHTPGQIDAGQIELFMAVSIQYKSSKLTPNCS